MSGPPGTGVSIAQTLNQAMTPAQAFFRDER
jgi:hypothetical protein